MFNLVKKSSNSVIQKLIQSGWLKRIVLILATISLVDLIVAGSFHKLLITAIAVLFLFGISKLSQTVKKFWNIGIKIFKQSSGFYRIVMFLATNSMVDLLTTVAFYKLLFTGLILFSVYVLFKKSFLYTVVCVGIAKAVRKIRKKTVKAN